MLLLETPVICFLMKKKDFRFLHLVLLFLDPVILVRFDFILFCCFFIFVNDFRVYVSFFGVVKL